MLKSIRILLSIAAHFDYEVWQMDVKTAYLNRSLDESIYMVQPDGFIQNGQEHKRIKDNKVIFLILYVDDILLIGNDVGALTSVKYWLAQQFDMKDLEEATYVLGIQILRDRKNKRIALSQASYIDKILVRFAMQNSKKGSLMNALLCTRPDICYAVGIVSRYQSNPGPEHWTAVKHILKYLRRTRDYMLAITLYCDNSGAVANAKESRSHQFDKYLGILHEVTRLELYFRLHQGIHETEIGASVIPRFHMLCRLQEFGSSLSHLTRHKTSS
ncbi:putative mitochondrial protein [Abeliophyllum distichum]|uniref:Mitochondrial protein n=1 Tax=Abeliophyllum distichum TaxID=126358 RepID=A0ABD1RQ40_9LAMI